MTHRSGNFLGSCAIAILTTLACAVSARAATVLQTSPLWAASTDYQACLAVNLTPSPLPSLKIDVIDAYTGTVVNTQTFTNIPSQTVVELTDGGPGATMFACCRFTGASAKLIRANQTVFEFTGPNGSDYQTKAFTEAHQK